MRLIAEDAEGQEFVCNVAVVMQFIAEDADGEEDAHNVAVVMDLAVEDVDGMEDVQHAVAVAIGFNKLINNEDYDDLYWLFEQMRPKVQRGFVCVSLTLQT